MIDPVWPCATVLFVTAGPVVAPLSVVEGLRMPCVRRLRLDFRPRMSAASARNGRIAATRINAGSSVRHRAAVVPPPTGLVPASVGVALPMAGQSSMLSPTGI
jgi:hypothetical protein